MADRIETQKLRIITHPNDIGNVISLGFTIAQDQPSQALRLHEWAVSLDGAKNTTLLLQTARIAMKAVGSNRGAKFVLNAIRLRGLNREIAALILDVVKHDPRGSRCHAVVKQIAIIYPDLQSSPELYGMVCYEEGVLDTAIRWLRRALVQNTVSIQLRLRFGYCLESLSASESAHQMYLNAVQVAPESSVAREFLAAWMGRNGRCGEARRIAQKRTSSSVEAPTPAVFQKMLDHEDVGRPFIRFEDSEIAHTIHHIVSLGRININSKLTIACNQRLHCILKRTFKNWEIINADALPSGPEVYSEAIPYIVEQLNGSGQVGPSIKAAVTREPQTSKSPIRVGITWRSSLRLDPSSFLASKASVREDLMRQMSPRFDARGGMWRKMVPLGAFQPFFDDRRFHITSVQYGISQEEQKIIRTVLKDRIHFTDNDFLDDFDDIAEVLSGLHAVVSVPNSHAHMAAALGISTHVLLHEVPVQLWECCAQDGVYRDLTLHRKPVVRDSSAQYSFQYSGDWRGTVDAARCSILKSWSNDKAEKSEGADAN